jgi:hypothetical protein
VRYFKARMAAKIGFITGEHMIRLLMLPWPMKIIIDHVILGEPIDADVSGFPAYLAPFVLTLRGMTATQIMLWMLVLGVLTVALMGMTLNRTAGGTEGGAFSSAATGAVRTSVCVAAGRRILIKPPSMPRQHLSLRRQIVQLFPAEVISRFSHSRRQKG